MFTRSEAASKDGMSETLGALTFASGALLGFSSSLHCAGMCGGIAATLMFTFDPVQGPAGRVKALLAAQAGRVSAYVAAGGFLGAAGTLFYGSMDHTAAHGVLRAVAAMSLGWVGLSVLGLVPSLAGFDRFAAPVAARLRSVSGGLSAAAPLAPYVAGLAWGLLPCGMVYAALFYASLSGSAASGAAVMAGFGLGTLPAVTFTALGIGSLRELSNNPRVRVIAGVSILTAAAASVLLPAVQSGLLCLH
jgi:sulfite exporter TauE/SafE